MTLTTEQSSNKAKYEAAPTAEIIDIIRTAMSQGCIRPCHVYDAVDELICRIQALENRPKRNCDVGAPEEQSRRFDQVCSFRFTGNCAGCKNPLDDSAANGVSDCALFWAQLPYEEGETK